MSIGDNYLGVVREGFLKFLQFIGRGIFQEHLN